MKIAFPEHNPFQWKCAFCAKKKQCIQEKIWATKKYSLLIVSVVLLLLPFFMVQTSNPALKPKPRLTPVPIATLTTPRPILTNQLSWLIRSSCSVSGATGATGTQIRNATAAPYNATPDDATDNYTAIQNAINDVSSAGGGVVTLPAGTFIINGHLSMKSNVKLMGVGPTTIIKAGPNFLNTTGPRGGYPLITTNGASNVTIANLTADQSGDTLNGNVEGRLAEYLVDIRSSTNAVVDGVYTRSPFTYSIAVVDSTRFCIKNSNTQVATSGKYNQLDGIHVLNSSFGDVNNNYIDQRYNGATDGDNALVAHTINGSVHDVSYARNSVRGGNHGAAMQLALSSASDQIYNLAIQNNEIWGSLSGIHTGFYSEGSSVHDVTIGGSLTTGNNFHDNNGDAVNFSGALSNIVVRCNKVCNSGSITVGAGSGNIVAYNIGCL